MAPDDIDQDKLAAEWAAALEDQDDDKPASQSDIDALFDQPAAGGGAKAGGKDDALAAEWAAALADEEEQSIKRERDQETLSRQSASAQFKNLTQEAKAPRPENVRRDLDFILDIPLDVSAELGRTKLLINELLQLGQGSVIELNKLAGEPLEIYVNGKLVARGEAVVINEKFGVRLTDIISPIERVKQLA
ncbi:MAG: flagellar motor switch protein FliN [Solidesulfovibrio sp.]|uniref:flagellar motor switch protein FliN n=1 Tax=Solidesulfovibrio sp. TaxID=2910990 RepID=UPI002B201C6E|nr:flagellar motor switch protein FliN [Solidesulfovibrio sp.]MEA4855099.1 flagellar motor switch protein FliN [Solidesulfovibrio sp.]